MGRRKLIPDEELLAKVREVFVREGTSVSSRKIAKEVGLSNSVLFQRFGSMEELMFAAMTPPAPDTSDMVGATNGRGTSALTHFENVAIRLVDYFRQLVPILLPLATHPSFSYETFRKRHPNAPLEKLTLELIAVYKAKSRSGEINCQDVDSLVLNLVTMAHSLAVFERIGVHDGSFSKETVRRLARSLWHGIAPLEPKRKRTRNRSKRLA